MRLDERDNGVLVGEVASLEDPAGLGRVQVTFPYLDGKPSDWARLVASGAGPERGLFLRPEVGDEVLVVFELGDPRRPYVLGGVWSQRQKPPADDGKAKANNWRFLRSRSGHLVKLDDTEGAERIEIADKDGERQVVLDSANQKIEVTAASGDVVVKAGSGKVEIEASEIQLKASGNLDVEASGTLTLKGATVNIN